MPPQQEHSDSNDGRLLARIDERTGNIIERLDALAKIFSDHGISDEKMFKELDARLKVVEASITRFLAWGGATVFILGAVWPLVRSYLHLPGP